MRIEIGILKRIYVTIKTKKFTVLRSNTTVPKIGSLKLSNKKLSDSKLFGNNLASELVENESFFKPITIEEIVIFIITAPFNYMRTLKFKAQPTNAFFATVNQMFGGSSQLPTTAERAVIKSNRLDNIVGSWEEPPNS